MNMKKTLKEELDRIHSITYGKMINEDGFLDFLNKKLNTIATSGTIDDPKKADFVSDDVKEFYQNLDDAAKKGGLSQQQRGTMTYQKEVESMQIGLMLLGYDLPKYGIDGLFGPETGGAVNKFTHENVENEGVSQTALQEAVEVIGNGPATVIGNPGKGTHNDDGWQSGNAWDITGNEGSEVFSITDGVVQKIKNGSSSLIRSGVKKIYGDQVTIKSTNGPDVFYTHIETGLQQGQNVKIGDVIGKIITSSGIPAHVHIGLSSGNIKDLAKVNGNAADGTGQGFTKATPDMLNKLSEMLKGRGVTSEDLKRMIDLKKKIGTLEGVAATDFNKMVNLIINKIEGGYYHPQMSKDGRANGMGSSGETMFGIDRQNGNWESRSEAGREFWRIIDNAKASESWTYNYMGGPYESQLRNLAAEMIKGDYITNVSNYLSPESQQIVNSSAKLTFDFIYASYNGSGWFRRFANEMNNSVANGTTDPEELSRRMIASRKSSSNNLIAKSGRKIEQIVSGSSAV